MAYQKITPPTANPVSPPTTLKFKSPFWSSDAFFFQMNKIIHANSKFLTTSLKSAFILISSYIAISNFSRKTKNTPFLGHFSHFFYVISYFLCNLYVISLILWHFHVPIIQSFTSCRFHSYHITHHITCQRSTMFDFHWCVSSSFRSLQTAFNFSKWFSVFLVFKMPFFLFIFLTNLWNAFLMVFTTWNFYLK